MLSIEVVHERIGDALHDLDWALKLLPPGQAFDLICQARKVLADTSADLTLPER
jgi:hypothetical protein